MNTPNWLVSASKKENETLDKIIDLMGQLKRSGHDLDCYSDEMKSARVAIHSARIANVSRIKNA